MFPNVRLMIAATLASVVALACGFGVFAVFRVSHEPFARSPVAIASLQLVADNTAYSSTGFDSSLRFDRRLQMEAQPSAAVTSDAPAAIGEHGAETGPGPSSAPEALATAADEEPSEVAQPNEQPLATVTPASGAPAAGADTTSANDQANVIAGSRPAATPEQQMSAAAPEDTAAPDPTAAATDQEVKPRVVSMADAGPVFSAAAVAVNQPHGAPQPLRDRLNPAGPPSDEAGPSAEHAPRTALKKSRVRVAVRIPRVQRVAAIPYAPPQFSQTQYTPATEQNFGGTQMNFQPATPSQVQYGVRPAAPARYVRLVSRKPRAPNTATGGPFVSATNR